MIRSQSKILPSEHSFTDLLLPKPKLDKNDPKKKFSKLYNKFRVQGNPKEETEDDETPNKPVDPRQFCCWKGGRFFDALKAMITRQIFMAHALLAIWRVTLAKHTLYWLLSLAFVSMFAEMVMVMTINHAKEWRLFCPSVFLYLLCVVPSIWILELDRLDRLSLPVANGNATGPVVQSSAPGVLPIQLSNDDWMLVLEQALLLVIILGRWMLPKGNLTRNQLSSLLLVYLATASDIIDFFTIITEDTVAQSKPFVYAILSVWTWSLLQFPCVVTATSEKSIIDMEEKRFMDEDYQPWYWPIIGCLKNLAALMETDAWTILVSLLLQDGPFVVMRMIAVFKFHVGTYSNYFFMAKNCIIFVLNMYRLTILVLEYRQMKREKEDNRMFGEPEDTTNFQDYVLSKRKPRTVEVTPTM